MALTIRNPSPSSLMLRSESRTSNRELLISANASATLAAVFTSKPYSCNTWGRVSRILGSSSTKRMRLREGIYPARLGTMSRTEKADHTLQQTYAATDCCNVDKKFVKFRSTWNSQRVAAAISDRREIDISGR